MFSWARRVICVFEDKPCGKHEGLKQVESEKLGQPVGPGGWTDLGPRTHEVDFMGPGGAVLGKPRPRF